MRFMLERHSLLNVDFVSNVRREAVSALRQEQHRGPAPCSTPAWQDCKTTWQICKTVPRGRHYETRPVSTSIGTRAMTELPRQLIDRRTFDSDLPRERTPTGRRSSHRLRSR